MSDPNELPGKYRVNYGTKDTLKRNLLEREIGFCTTDKQCYIKGMAENPGEEAPLLPMGSGGSGECNLFVGDIDTSNAEWLEAYRSGKELRFKGLAGLVPEDMLDMLGPYLAPNAIHNSSVRVIANTLIVISLTIDLVESQLYVELMQGSLGNDDMSPDEYRVMEIAMLFASKLPVAFHRYDPEVDYPLEMVPTGTPIISFFTSADGSYIPTAAFYGVGGSLDLLEVEMLLMGQLPDSIHDWGVVEMMYTMGVLYAMEKCGPMFLTGLYDADRDKDSGIVEVHEKSDALSGVTSLLPTPYEFSIIDFTLITPSSSGSYGYSNEMEELIGNVSDGIAMCYMAAAPHDPSLTDPKWDFEEDYYIQVKVIMDRNGIFVGDVDTAYDEWMTAYNSNKALFVKLEGLVVPVQYVKPELEAMTDFTTDTWVEGLAYDQPVFRFGASFGDSAWSQGSTIIDILPNSMWHHIMFPYSAIIELERDWQSGTPELRFGFEDNMLGISFHGTEEYTHDIAWGVWLSSVRKAYRDFGWTLYGVWNDYSRYGILLQSFGGNYHGDDNAPYGYLYAVDAEGALDVEWYEDDWGDPVFDAEYGCDADAWPLYLGWDPGSASEIYFEPKVVATVIADSTTLPVNVTPTWCSRYAVTPQYPASRTTFEGYVYVIVPAALGNVTLTAGNLDFMVSGPTTLEAGKKYELHLMHRTLTIKELTILSQAENPYITSSSSDEDVAEYLGTDTRELLDAAGNDGSVDY